LGKFWRALDWKVFIYFMAVWNILRWLGTFYDHLVHCVFIWYTFSGFGSMYQEKSGNPGQICRQSAAYVYTKRCFHTRAARLFLVQEYQNGEKYTKLPRTILNVHKI
jgi:hypothetical protein